MSDPDKNLVDETIEVSELDLAPQKQLSAAAAVEQSVWARVLIIAINASTGILSARALRPQGRGELAAMILWPVFLGSALTLGVPSALTFQMRQHRERERQLVGAGLLFALLTSCLAMLIGAIFLPLWLRQYSPETVFYARLFLLSAPLTSFILVGRAALESDGNFTASNTLLLGSPALTLVWLVVLWLMHSMTPVRAAFAYVPAGVLPVGWMLHLLWRRFSPSLHHLRTSTGMLFSYGVRSYGIDLCGTLALYVDQALVVRILSPAAMGTYVVALSLSRMLNAFHAAVVVVLFPKAVGQEPASVREMTGRAARLSTVLTTAAGAIIVLIGPQALTLLYGREYRGALAVLDVLIVEVILSGATLVLSQAFMALGRPGIITVLQVFGLLFSVPLIMVLAARFGILGAGIALLIATTARLLFVLLSFPVFLKLPVPAVLPGLSDIRSLHGLFVQRLRRRAV